MRVLKPTFYFYGYVAIALVLLLWRTEGHFTYGLDDAYIHLALAKNVALNGVWGVTPHAPSSCSSSILWPLLLGGLMHLFGPSPLIPFLLSLAIATGFLWWLHRTLGAYMGGGSGQRRLVLWIAFGSCLATLVFGGMEHVLQVCASLCFAWQAARALSAPALTWRRAWPLLLLAPLMVSTRYEDLALVAPVCVLLTLRHGVRGLFGRDLLMGVAVCLSALAPVLAFGLAMQRLDLPFLPYSVQLKSWFSVLGLSGVWLHLGPKFIYNGLCHPELVFLLVSGMYTLRHRLRGGEAFWRIPSVLQVIFITACLLHLEFASTGFYARYVAYLTALGVCALGLEGGPLFQAGFRPARRQAETGLLRRFLAGGTVLTLVLMAVACHLAVPQKACNIYQQQIQMARFLGAYYDGQAVALNDIGTSSFGADIRLVDLFGLASKEVAEARLHGHYGRKDIDRITREHNVQVAIVYKRWYGSNEGSELPRHWKCVGEWTIPLNIICGWHTVSIFAVDPAAREQLVRNLADFSDKLPEAVKQRGIYTEE